MYRYGDGSPFPFEENFIDIMSNAVEACSAMFAAAAELDAARVKARDARKDAEEEGRRLVALEKAVEQALFPSRPSNARDATVTQQTAQRLLGTVKTSIGASKVQLEKLATAAASEPQPDRAAVLVHAAAGRFFDRTALPGTAWTWRWQASDGMAVATGEATSRVGRFGVVYDLELSPAWRAPLKISALAPNLLVLLPRQRLFGKPSIGRVHLDKCVLMRANFDGSDLTLIIRASAKRSPGWRIMLPESGAPVATALDKSGKPVGGEIELDGDQSGLINLIDAIIGAMDTMREHRRAREVTLGDTPVTQVPDPTHAPRALLESLAPTIRNIRQRSRVPGELCLKRDIADGRREELFLPRASLAARFARLPPEHRRYFEEAGLAREDTVEVSDADLDTNTGQTEPVIPASGPGAPTMRMSPRAVA
jgi:hypothetical protein